MARTITDDRRLELTYRGLVLGGLITLVFTAANVYLGLKIGLTFASSLPAAVISMAVLRGFKTSTIWENNIVQTVASAAGTLSSIIFVLPGLVMVGWWTGFPFWESFGICLVGGVLGVMYSVPLRRAMVTGSDLPYPEGVAAAEVLMVGAGATRQADADPAAVAENKAGFATMLWGSVASFVFVAVIGTKLFAENVAAYVRVGAAATGYNIGLSLALIGVGHLVGVTVGIAMLAGIVLAWGVLVPLLSSYHPATADVAALADTVFHNEVRLIGAGAIGVAALWSVGRLARPVVGGVISSLAAARTRATGQGDTLPITERDIPFNIVLLVSALALVPLAVLLFVFLSGTALSSIAIPLVLGALVYVVLAGLIVAAVCGYMAGLIGSSNSPVSGLAILTVLGAALLLLAVARPADPLAAKALVAFALFVTAVVINVATISNDNLQDLKTGQLVGATPWRQQLGQLDWKLIGYGALIGLVIVAIDEILRRTVRRQFPPLAVALGIYLPMAVTFMVVVGAFVGKVYNSWVASGPNAAAAKRLGVLLASGLIVGESLFGVLLSGIVKWTNKDAPLDVFPALGLKADNFQMGANVLGVIAFIAVVAGLYRWVGRLGQRIS